MKFSRLLKESRLFWPSVVRVDDVEPRKGGGAYFPRLSKVWHEAELVQSNINEWHSLMSWIVFCGFHKAALDRINSDKAYSVKFSELDQRYMAKRYSENLRVVYPSFPRHMRSQYVDDTHS